MGRVLIPALRGGADPASAALFHAARMRHGSCKWRPPSKRGPAERPPRRSLVTPDNVRTFVGNGKVFSETIQNFSTNRYRRVECKAQLAHGANHEAAIKLLRDKLAAIPNTTKDPKPEIEILDFTLAGPVLAVRAFCHTDHYWDVYFGINKIIREDLGALQLPVPSQHFHLQQIPTA